MSSGHTLDVRFEDGIVHLSVTCREPEGSECRLTCVEECESWDQYCRDKHGLIDGGECNAVLFIQGEGETACGREGGFPLSDGMPIEVAWDSGGYVWRPAQ